MSDNIVTPTPTGRPHMPAGYGLAAVDAGQLLPWSWLSRQMAESRNYWICSTRPDGRPHAVPVWGVWVDDALYFGTDPQSRKGKNLAANPAVAVHLESGDEVVIIEGRVEPLTDTGLMPRLDEAYEAKYQLKLSEAGGEASILMVRPKIALAWLERDFPNTATRWQFG